MSTRGLATMTTSAQSFRSGVMVLRVMRRALYAGSMSTLCKITRRRTGGNEGVLTGSVPVWNVAALMSVTWLNTRADDLGRSSEGARKEELVPVVCCGSEIGHQDPFTACIQMFGPCGRA
eukprot:2014633-Rhodomonas_salina.2